MKLLCKKKYIYATKRFPWKTTEEVMNDICDYVNQFEEPLICKIKFSKRDRKFLSNNFAIVTFRYLVRVPLLGR